ncbi:hypothetical protein V1282_001717 [Nitrobacteraceae bacterium AZCC 2146]
MTAKLQNARVEAVGASSISRPSPVQLSTRVEPAGDPAMEQSLLSGRKLRNRIILANAMAWIAIIVGIRVIFF